MFNVIDPGTLCRNTVRSGSGGGQATNAKALNDYSEVVGYSETDDQPFRWTAAGGMVDLGTLADGSTRIVGGPMTSLSLLVCLATTTSAP